MLFCRYTPNWPLVTAAGLESVVRNGRSHGLRPLPEVTFGWKELLMGEWSARTDGARAERNVSNRAQLAPEVPTGRSPQVHASRVPRGSDCGALEGGGTVSPAKRLAFSC